MQGLTTYQDPTNLEVEQTDRYLPAPESHTEAHERECGQHSSGRPVDWSWPVRFQREREEKHPAQRCNENALTNPLHFETESAEKPERAYLEWISQGKPSTSAAPRHDEDTDDELARE